MTTNAGGSAYTPGTNIVNFDAKDYTGMGEWRKNQKDYKKK